MILRPFLHMAIHDLDLPPEPPSSAWSSQTNSPAAMTDIAATPPNAMVNTPPMVRQNSKDANTNDSGIFKVVKQCIDAAIQSTIAFDRVGADPDRPYRNYIDTPEQRFIVTNIFGTLHAYVWQNHTMWSLTDIFITGNLAICLS